MDGVASGLTLVAACIAITSRTKRLLHDYQDAPKQILHAQQQGLQFQVNQDLLDALPPSQKAHIGPAQKVLKDAQSSLLRSLQLEGRRDRFKWITGQKSQTEDKIAQYQNIESSITLNLLLALCQDL